MTGTAPLGAAVDRSGGNVDCWETTDARKDSTAAYPIEAPFERLFPLQLRPVWEYKIAGGDACRLLVPQGATRDEALQQLERRWPGKVEYLKPAGVEDRGNLNSWPNEPVPDASPWLGVP